MPSPHPSWRPLVRLSLAAGLLVACQAEPGRFAADPSRDPGAPDGATPAPEADAAPLFDAAPESDADPRPTPNPMPVEPGDPSEVDPTPEAPDPAPEPPSTDPNLLDQDQLFVCDGLPAASPARIRRLERQEWANIIRHPNGARVPFLPESDHRYATYSSGETFDSTTLREFMRNNDIPGNTWAIAGNNGNPRLMILRGAHRTVGGIDCFQWGIDGPNEAEPDDACIDDFVRAFLEKGVLFRPPTDDEVAPLVAFARTQVERERADPEFDRRDTVRALSQAAWMMPSAIFRAEVGGEPEQDGRRRLTDHELAAALSLAFGDHIAGLSKVGYSSDGDPNPYVLADVRAALEDGSIGDPAVISALARRYLAGVDPEISWPEAAPSDYPPNFGVFIDHYWLSAKLQGFFQEWLGHADAAAVFKDTPQATTAFAENRIPVGRPHWRWDDFIASAQDRAELTAHLDALVARIVAEDEDVFRTLMTTRRYLLQPMSGDDYAADSAMYTGFMYGLDVRETGPIGESMDARWYTLPDDQRAGVLTHPAWLAAHGGNFENDPSAVHRGRWIYEELLCGRIPPVTVDVMLSPESAGLSARERLRTELEARAECAACHGRMNPLGYAFETYNHAGWWRVDDHGAPPSGQTRLAVVPGDDPLIRAGAEFADAVALAEALGDSPRAERCFIRQSFRYFAGRDETYADACTLQRMEQAYHDSGGSMIDMLAALFTSDTFQYRVVREPEVQP